VSVSRDKPRLLFFAVNLGPYGGGSCVTAWALQALRRDWEVTIFCASYPDFDGVNKHFGTNLQKEDFSIWQLPFPLRHLDKLDPDPFSAQRLAWLMRFCQARCHQFDVVVSTDDEIDFGRPGVQYTHYPHMECHLSAFRSVENLTRGQKIKALLSGKLRPWLWISGIKLSRIRSNLMVTNSHWTARQINRIYGVEPVVLYPPVRWSGEKRDRADRKPSFISLGRLSPDKRLMEVIDIMERVRQRGFEIELEIIGNEDQVAGQTFIRRLRERIVQAGGWVRLHESIDRAELEAVVSGSRFGIHAMIDEHFGIAVAEMMRAGCIVFVPDNGGQVEIIGKEPGLCYRSDDDAVEKICALLTDETEQDRLQSALGQRADNFSESRFMDGMREIVTDFASKTGFTA
jgi:glycosyltransferase involved in cell wall biosynthesis